MKTSQHTIIIQRLPHTQIISGNKRLDMERQQIDTRIKAFEYRTWRCRKSWKIYIMSMSHTLNHRKRWRDLRCRAKEAERERMVRDETGVQVWRLCLVWNCSRSLVGKAWCQCHGFETDNDTLLITKTWIFWHWGYWILGPSTDV